MIWRISIGILVTFVLSWLVLVVFLILARPKGSLLQEALRLIPDTLGLMRRLAGDAALPRGVRIRLWILLVYVATPFDLIPDFIPVIGYADDAIIVAAVLRSVARRAGPGAVRRHWRGTEEGLTALWRVAGLPGSRPDPPSTPTS